MRLQKTSVWNWRLKSKNMKQLLTMEKVQQKLKESNEELKTKAETSGSDLIKTKREINELKSNGAFKESKLKDLEEKNKEIEKFYETEGAQWKTKFEETS